MYSPMNRFLTAVLLLVAMAFSGFAQSNTALTGVVLDPTGAAVPDAAVTITNTDTNERRESKSDAQGRYSFLQVPPGAYRLLAKKSGFADVSVQNIRLLVSSPATLNITFESVGSVAQTVEVSAEGIQLNTTDATLGNAFSTKPITQLPFEGRRADRILSLQPGISYIGDSDTVNGGSDTATDRNGSVNGGRSDQSNITLDGVDINNQQTRDPFQGALRVTLDSVQEFRVTTTNANADSSRGSGAQISLITRSGTNEFHGAAYWYLRNKIFNANTFFNNSTVDAQGNGLATPKLNRNIYGGRIGGPIVKNKLFFFGNWEGQQDRLEQSVVRTVPRENMRNGIVNYLSVGGQQISVQPAELLSRLPDARQINQAALETLRSYPLPNDFTTGDGINTAGFRFNTPLQRRFNTYVLKFDYVANDKNRFFVRGQLQNDNEQGPPQYPGRAPNFVDLNNSKGLAAGWDSTITPSLISTTRFGFTRQGIETAGIGVFAATTFRGLSDPVGLTRPFRRIAPTYNGTQDFTWLKGNHTFQFGGSLRVYQNDRASWDNSFFGSTINSSWMTASGQILSAPWNDAALGANRIVAGSRTSFNDATAAVLGLVTQVNSRYNYVPRPDGSVIAQAPGTPVLRNFQGEEAEIYFQDTWKVTRNLTITGGIRYMYWPAIYEKNGVQTNTNIPISEWFDRRVAAADNGIPVAARGIPPISYQLANQPGGRPLYDNLNNWSPRLSIAYSPEANSGLSKFLFGGPGKSVIRAGWGMYYDVFGAGLIRAFDASALGLSTNIPNSSGRLTIADAPRFTGILNIPQQLVSPPPPAQFPVVQPDNFQITNSLDDRLRAPYVMRWNLSVSREFARGWQITGSYVASEGRRTLTSEDAATPLNLRDPQSGQTYFEAAQALTEAIRRDAPASSVGRIPFWENMYPGLARPGVTATQGAYEVFSDVFPDATFGLELLDRFCDPTCSRLGRFAFYSPQYSYLRVIRSVGFSSYHSMQWQVQKRFTNGDQFGFNWTWSHSIDLGSVTENNQSTNDGLRGVIINPYNRAQMRASSDFDQRHNFNANWVYGLPIGQGKAFGSGMGRFANAVLGGWQVAGLFRMTTGLNTSVGHNRTWPTNYNITGWATQVGPVIDGSLKNAPAPPGGRSGPNIFADPAVALRSFTFTAPGEIGNRNQLRGDGIFNLDASLAKNFKMPVEGHSLQFRWEVFNVTNTVRFDPRDINLSLANPSAFGRYADTLGGPRVMQFALRYEF